MLNEWTPIFQAENKLAKSRDEYKSYVEKYGRVRDDFEEKMIKATRLFQAHDEAYLLQMKAFLAIFARALNDSAAAASQVFFKFPLNYCEKSQFYSKQKETSFTKGLLEKRLSSSRVDCCLSPDR